MVEDDELARDLGVLPEQLAELRELVETDTADRVVDEVEVAGVDAVDRKDADRTAGKEPDVGQSPPLPPFFQPRADNREVFGPGTRAPQTETGGVMIAGDHEEPAEIEPTFSDGGPQDIPRRELTAIADIPRNEHQVCILNWGVLQKPIEVGIHVTGTVLFPASIVGCCQVKVGEVGDGDRGGGVC